MIKGDKGEKEDKSDKAIKKEDNKAFDRSSVEVRSTLETGAQR